MGFLLFFLSIRPTKPTMKVIVSYLTFCYVYKRSFHISRLIFCFVEKNINQWFLKIGFQFRNESKNANVLSNDAQENSLFGGANSFIFMFVLLFTIGF